MHLPAGDTELVRIMDAALVEASRQGGSWLACKPGCTQCCHGAFAINALDAARLRTGMKALEAADPSTAKSVRERARSWLTEFGPNFPGELATGLLGSSEEDQARFENWANYAPCPALNPVTGLCDVYEWRPMTCRVFGPPTRMGDGEALCCCELCFIGASEAEIASCEMPVPYELEKQLLVETEDSGETIVAFSLQG